MCPCAVPAIQPAIHPPSIRSYNEPPPTHTHTYSCIHQPNPPGRKRTAEITEKLQAADKGDLLDFRMDGGMSAQVFEGQDYSKGRNKVRG